MANLQDLTLTIEVQNKAAKGQILIDKQGPILSAWQAEAYPYLAYVDASDTEEGTKGQWVERSIDVYRPVFSRSYLEGAVFEVRAAEDLYLGDGTLAYRQGDFVETITTKREGPSTSQEIPLGKYTVQEVTAPAGYAQNSTVQTITLSQENPAQALVQESVAIANEKQQGEISFTKTFENSPWFPLYEDAAGAVVFGLFTEKEIVQDGVSLPAGTCVGVTKLDEQRKGQFSGLLADQSYVLRELATAQEYQLNRSDYQIALRAVDKTTPVSKVELAEPIANKLKTHEIVLTKLDQKSGKALAGAVFTLLAVTPDGDIAIGEYSTDQNGVLTIKNLHAGTYYLQEVRAPEGYYLDKKKIPLVLDGSTSIHTEAVTNESTVVTFYKRDKEKLSLVPGATLQVLDQEGTVIHEWVSDGTAHQLEGILVAGKEYILREVKAPKGYLPSADVRFFVPLTQEAQEAEILNEQTVTEISKQRAGGEELPGAKLELFDDQGVLLESWTSSDKPHIVRGLEPGKTYTLHEDAAPAGYQLAQDIQFTINEDGSVTKVKMVNLEVPEVPTTGEAEQYGLHIALLGLCFLGMKKLFVKKRED